MARPSSFDPLQPPARRRGGRSRSSASGTLHTGRLVALALSVVVALVLWDTVVAWPLRLLVVAIHETGHAVATWLVGGSVVSLSVASNESGRCLSMLPSGLVPKVLVYSAGYVGSALAGAAMLLGTLRWRLGRGMLMGLAAWLAAVGLLHAGDPFTVLFCLGMGVAFAVGARRFPMAWVESANLFLATFVGLYALFDLRSDLWDARVRASSDAALLANVTWVPALVWAVLWSVGSMAVLALALKVALSHSRR